MIKRLLGHIFLLGVIIGLSGQSVAVAAGSCAAMANEQNATVAIMVDCAEGEHNTDKGSVPCEGLTPGCVAMMGCTAAVAPDLPVAILDASDIVTIAAIWSASAVLHGRYITPEPDPPSFFG